MELEDLGGKLMMLDGVDFFDINKKNVFDHTAHKCNFRLDGIVYSVVEDPDDGFRSRMREIIATENKDMMNTFEPMTVSTNYIKTDYMNILELLDVQSKKSILSVGTNYTDDYYPCFVADFRPENMSVNSNVDEGI